MIADILYKQRTISNNAKKTWLQRMDEDIESYVKKWGLSEKLVDNLNTLLNPSKYLTVLNNLWNSSYNLGKAYSDDDSNFHLSTSPLSTFESRRPSLSRTILKARRQMEEKTTEDEELPISDQEFGQTYLMARNKFVFDKFSKDYKKNIRKSIKGYLKKDKGQQTEIQLMTGLKQNLDLSKPKEFDAWFDVAYHSGRYPRGFGNDYATLKKEARKNPQRFQDFVQTRLDNIAQTEVAAGYNLGRIAKHVNNNVRYFMWDSRMEYTTKRIQFRRTSRICELCKSLEGKIIDLGNIPLKSMYMDFSNFNTRRPVTDPSNGTGKLYIPCIHPQCYCSLIALKDENDLEKYKAALLAANAASLIKAVKNHVTSSGIDKAKGLAMNILKMGAIGMVAAKGVDMANKELVRQMYLNQLRREEEIEKERRKKMLIVGGSVLATGVMMYFFLKNKSSKEVKPFIPNTTDQFVEVPATTVTAAIAKPPKKVSAITPKQVSAITPKKVSAITPTKVSAITPKQESKITSVLEKVEEVVMDEVVEPIVESAIEKVADKTKEIVIKEAEKKEAEMLKKRIININQQLLGRVTRLKNIRKRLITISRKKAGLSISWRDRTNKANKKLAKYGIEITEYNIKGINSTNRTLVNKIQTGKESEIFKIQSIFNEYNDDIVSLIEDDRNTNIIRETVKLTGKANDTLIGIDNLVKEAESINLRLISKFEISAKKFVNVAKARRDAIKTQHSEIVNIEEAQRVDREQKLGVKLPVNLRSVVSTLSSKISGVSASLSALRR